MTSPAAVPPKDSRASWRGSPEASRRRQSRSSSSWSSRANREAAGVEELAIRTAEDFDAFYEQRAAARDPKDDLLVISTDGKGVVMRHEDLREGTRRAAETSTRKLGSTS